MARPTLDPFSEQVQDNNERLAVEAVKANVPFLSIAATKAERGPKSPALGMKIIVTADCNMIEIVELLATIHREWMDSLVTIAKSCNVSPMALQIAAVKASAGAKFPASWSYEIDTRSLQEGSQGQ